MIHMVTYIVMIHMGCIYAVSISFMVLDMIHRVHLYVMENCIDDIKTWM